MTRAYLQTTNMNESQYKYLHKKFVWLLLPNVMNALCWLQRFRRCWSHCPACGTCAVSLLTTCLTGWMGPSSPSMQSRWLQTVINGDTLNQMSYKPSCLPYHPTMNEFCLLNFSFHCCEVQTDPQRNSMHFVHLSLLPFIKYIFLMHVCYCTYW